MPGSGTSGQKTLGYFLTSTMFPIPPWPPEGGSCSPRCLRPGYRGQHQSPQIELALVNPVADDLGRTRCTPSRVRNGPANHESTHDPEEAIGPRSETIVANVSTAAKSIFALSLFSGQRYRSPACGVLRFSLPARWARQEPRMYGRVTMCRSQHWRKYSR